MSRIRLLKERSRSKKFCLNGLRRLRNNLSLIWRLSLAGEITPFIEPEDMEVTVDYNSVSDNWGYYILESQFISYSAPNFSLDAAIEEIIAPKDGEMENRFNPICGHPIIVIKNNGETPLTSLTIEYNVSGGSIYSYNWTGNLQFLETQKVNLPAMDWNDFTDDTQEFEITISD